MAYVIHVLIYEKLMKIHVLYIANNIEKKINCDISKCLLINNNTVIDNNYNFNSQRNLLNPIQKKKI